MPDLQDRTEREDELAAALLLLLRNARTELDGYLGSPPSLQGVPSAYWDDLARDIQRTLRDHLGSTHEAAAAGMLRAGLPDFAEKWVYDAMAGEWSESRASQLATSIVGHIRSEVEEAVREYQQSVAAAVAAIAVALAGRQPLTPAQQEAERERVTREAQDVLREKLDEQVYSETRAERVAVTETTGSITAGEEAYIETLKRRFGGRLVYVAYWITERDDRVCPICRPLNARNEDYWRPRVPSGPPAHPSCRCRLRWVITIDDGEPVTIE